MNELRSGKSLIEASLKNNVPRSTLYVKAKSSGITMTNMRNDYPPECMKGAMEAVISNMMHFYINSKQFK